MTDFTPGPWILDEIGGVNGNGYRVASVAACTAPRVDPKEIRANAALIAAAPEMYETLEKACKFIADEYGFPESQALAGEHVSKVARPVWNAICDVLGKANGG